jgi:hypothetical protein
MARVLSSKMAKKKKRVMSKSEKRMDVRHGSPAHSAGGRANRLLFKHELLHDYTGAGVQALGIDAGG